MLTVVGERREQGQGQAIYTPRDVAARLGISEPRVRQLAALYERVHGDLPCDESGPVWLEEAVERLDRAHSAVIAGRAASVEQALREPESATAKERGADSYLPTSTAIRGEHAALMRELKLLRGAVEGMSRRLADVERENAKLREAVGTGRELEALRSLESTELGNRSTTSEVADRGAQQTTVRRSPSGFVAQGAWLALAALSVGLFVASIPAAYAQLSIPCGRGAGCDFMQLSPDHVKILEEWGFSTAIYAAYIVALCIVVALGYWVAGYILFRQGSGQRLGLYASMAFVTFGTVLPNTLHWLAEANPLWYLPSALVYFVGYASFFVLFCVFPDGRFLPRWTRWAAAAWIAYQLLYTFFPSSPLGPKNWPTIFERPLFYGLIGSLVLAQIYRYRRVSDTVGRRQTRWIVLSFTAAIVVFTGVSLIGLIFEPTRSGIPEVLYESVGALVVAFAALLIPLSTGAVILRGSSAIIKYTLVYGSLTNVLAVVYVIMDTLLLPLLLQSLLGVDNSSLTQIVSGVIIAVLFKPVRSRIEADVSKLVDRLLDVDKTSESTQ